MARQIVPVKSATEACQTSDDSSNLDRLGPFLVVQDGGGREMVETLPYIPTEDNDDPIHRVTKLSFEPFGHVWVVHQGKTVCSDRLFMVC